jgi:hypothetical protein
MGNWRIRPLFLLTSKSFQDTFPLIQHFSAGVVPSNSMRFDIDVDTFDNLLMKN